MIDVQKAFGPGGPLARGLPGYSHRDFQVSMARVIADVLQGRKNAVLEAGTGTGKTFSYLVPLLLSGKKAIVSTSTRGLQEQLFNKDIPELARALGVGVDARLLKGRGNYLCLHRLAEALGSERTPTLFPDDRFFSQDLEKVARYAQETSDGDRAGVKDVKSFSKVWPLVTSTQDNCLAAACPEYHNCFVYKARNQAKAAQLVVANHALLMSDAAWSDNRLLPGFEVCVFDEGHHLTDDLTNFFATVLSTSEMTATLEEHGARLSGSDPVEGPVANAIGAALDLLFELDRVAREARRPDVLAREALSSGAFSNSLADLVEVLRSMCPEGPQEPDDGDEGSNLHELSRWATDVCGKLGAWQKESDDEFSWLEARKETVLLKTAPLDTARLFQEHFATGRTVAIVSATLSVAGSLDHVAEELGLENVEQHSWGSPFDYEANSMLLLPAGLPDPSQQREFVSACCQLVAELAAANGGRAFFLLATRGNLNMAARLLDDLVGGQLEVLVQGSEPPDILVGRFKGDEGRDKVLAGTRTFWQGVDIPGRALSLVVIDKVPFVPPSDPIMRAREQLLDEGENPFMRLQLPKAVLAMKQAAGRLIRGVGDKGLLAICDPRITQKSYGGVILDSLPPMRRTEEVDEAKKFLGGLHG